MGRTRRLVTAVAAVTLIAAFAGACGGGTTPAPTPAPKLTDVKAIAAKAATAAESAKAIHAKIAVTGKVKFDAGAFTGGLNPDATEPAGSSAPTEFDLAGTSAEIWMNVGSQDVHMTLNAQPLMNTTADLIQTGGYSYIKIGGPFASMLGDSAGKYIKSKATDPLPVASASAAAAEDINSVLGKPGVDAKLVGTEQVNGREAYHLTMNVPQDALSSGSDMGVSISNAKADLYVAVDNGQLIRAVLNASDPKTGTLVFTADLDYPASVTITAPPADQVVEQPMPGALP